MSGPSLSKENEKEFAGIIADLRLHGFESLRATTHAMLYRFKEFTYSIPLRPVAVRDVRNQLAGWERMKREVYAAYPGLKAKVDARIARSGNGQKPSDVDAMEPVTTLEDLVGEQKPIDVPVVDKQTGEPVPMPPEAASGAGTRRKPVFRECPVPECGQRASGKHNEWHRRRGEWRPEYDRTPTESKRESRRRLAGKLPEPAAEKLAATNLGAVTTALDKAFEKIHEGMEMARKAVSALARERDFYKEEMDKQADALQRMDAALSTIRKRGGQAR